MQRFTLSELAASGMVGARQVLVGHGSTLHLAADGVPHESFVGIVVRPTGVREFWSWQNGARFVCEPVAGTPSTPRRSNAYSMFSERSRASMLRKAELS